MNKFLIVIGTLLATTSFAQPRPCTDTQMKGAKRMDVRTDSSEMNSQIYLSTNGENSLISLNVGYNGTPTTTIYFVNADNSSCAIKLSGATIAFQIPANSISTPAVQLGMPMLMGCAGKFTRVKSNPSLGGMEITAANGKTLGELGLYINVAQKSVGIVTPINNPVLAGFGCGN